MKYFFGIFLFTMLAGATAGQEAMPLYGATIPGNKAVPDREKSETSNGRERISNVTHPTLAVYLPPKHLANGTAVIICPGGGYARLAITHEGYDVAKEFNDVGVAAFVLKYRIPDDAAMTNKSIAPLQDAQMAIKTVRDSAESWGISRDKVGIAGFSAGGHLASTAGTHFEKAVIQNPSGTNLRPDFMILLYPVISLSDSAAHMGSRENLVGKSATPEMIELFSNNLQVTDRTPSTFLVHASDDGAVKPVNSILFYEALLKHKVPAEMHLYQRGGHGFGLVNPTTQDLWFERCKNWMKASGWL